MRASRVNRVGVLGHLSPSFRRAQVHTDASCDEYGAGGQRIVPSEWRSLTFATPRLASE